MTSTLITNIGELVTNDPGARRTCSARSRTPRSSSRAARSPGSGRAADAPAADDARSTSAAGRCCPGFVDSHSHLVFAGDRSAEFAARMAGEPYAAGGIRTTVAATRAATDEQLTSHVARLVAEMRAPGHDHGRDQERLRPQRARRGAQPRGGAGSSPRRRRSSARTWCPTGTDARRSTSRWSPARCWRRRRRTPAGSTCSARRGAFDADQARAVLEAGAAAGLRGRLHANQLGPGPGVRLAAELGLVAVDHCTYLDDADVDALRDVGHHRDPAAGRGVLDPAALPGRPPAARRRRAGGAGQRLQPRLVLHQLAAVLHRAGGAGDGDDPGRGRPRRHRHRGAAALDRDDVGVLRPGPPRRPDGARRPDATCTWPTAPASPRQPGLAAGGRPEAVGRSIERAADRHPPSRRR